MVSPRSRRTALEGFDLLLALGFDQFQHPELLLRDVGERDRQPDALRVQNAETTPNQRAVRRIHRLFEQVLRTAGPVTDVDGLPVRAAGGAAIQFGLRRVSAPAATEDAVGTLFI